MEYAELIMIVLLIAFQNFVSKQYSAKGAPFNIWLFSGITTFGALIFFLVNAGFRIEYVLGVLPYSLLFAFCFGAASIGSVMAMKSGMFSLSTLANSYSLVIPTLYGILFLNDNILITGYVGIVLLFVSIYLLNKKKESFHFSVSWLIWIAVTFFWRWIFLNCTKNSTVKI